TVIPAGRSREGVVEIARAETFEVERDVAVTGGTHGLDDLLTGGEHSRQLVEIDLDARGVVVMTHAALRESECVQRRLGTLDATEDRHSHSCAVGDAAGHTRSA